MVKQEKYIPVPCDFIDYIEMFALKNTVVDIYYYQSDMSVQHLKTTIKTWTNEGGVEYLITASEHRIRLDRIIKINDIVLKNFNCS